MSPHSRIPTAIRAAVDQIELPPSARREGQLEEHTDCMTEVAGGACSGCGLLLGQAAHLRFQRACYSTHLCVSRIEFIQDGQQLLDHARLFSLKRMLSVRSVGSDLISLLCRH